MILTDDSNGQFQQTIPTDGSYRWILQTLLAFWLLLLLEMTKKKPPLFISRNELTSTKQKQSMLLKRVLGNNGICHVQTTLETVRQPVNETSPRLSIYMLNDHLRGDPRTARPMNRAKQVLDNGAFGNKETLESGLRYECSSSEAEILGCSSCRKSS